MVELSQSDTSIIDWVVVGLSGAACLLYMSATAYVGTYGGSAAKHAGASFNYLWSARMCFQIAAAAYTAAQILRLQVLWGPQSVFGDPAGRWSSTAMCRVYIAVLYGLCEPVVLLLALFACVYSVQSKLSPPLVTGGVVWEPQAPAARQASIKHPNFNIVFFALGFTLPACTAQLVCALFTRIFDVDYQAVPLYRVMFTPFDQRETAYCPADVDNPDTSCAWCVFPVLSTLISGAFLVAFLLALWVVTGRIAAAAISKLLIKRIRTLQVVVTVSLLGSLGCRAASVLFEPFALGFELLRLAHVLLFGVGLMAMSHLLVWQPVRDSQLADKHLAAYTEVAGGPAPGDRGLGGGWQGERGTSTGMVTAGPGGLFWQSSAAPPVAAPGSVAGSGPEGATPGGTNAGRGATINGLTLSALRAAGDSGSARRGSSSSAAAAAPGSVASKFSGITLGGGVGGDAGGGGFFNPVSFAQSQPYHHRNLSSGSNLNEPLNATSRRDTERQPLVSDAR